MMSSCACYQCVSLLLSFAVILLFAMILNLLVNTLKRIFYVLNYSYVQFHTFSIYSKCCVSCGIECTVFFQLVSYNKLGIVTGFISKYNYTSFSEDCLSLHTV